MSDEKKSENKEEAFNKKLTERIEQLRNEPFHYEIKHGFSHYPQNLTAEVSIKIAGGALQDIHALGIEMQKLILAYAEKTNQRSGE